MKSSTVAIGDEGKASQYNNLREDARASSYLLAHEQSSPDLTLKVEKGNFLIGKTNVAFAGGSSPSFTAPSVNPRIDLLVINSSGTLSRVAGTEAASPVVPTIPSDKIVIAEVFNRVGQTSIKDVDDSTNGYIQKDARPFLKNDNFKLDQDGSVNYAADGGGSDTYVITLDPAPTAYTVGMVINFKANTANTGAATLNVNGLGAKTIKKIHDIDLANGEVESGQIVTVIYDGTDFQMQSQLAVAAGTTYKNGTTSKDAADASTTQNIAHGLGKIPKKVKLTAIVHNGSVGMDFTTVVYNGTTKSAIFARNAENSGQEGTLFQIGLGDANSHTDGVITFDTTNIIITWTKTGSPILVYQILWEAEA